MSPLANALILIAVGLVLAFTGKRLFWLLVGLAGFVLGYYLVGLLLPVTGLIQLGIGIAAGVLAGILATRFTRFLQHVAGFLLLGLFAVTAWGWAGFATTVPITILVFLVGGLIGLGLVSFLADFALTVVTTLGGAALVVRGVSGYWDASNSVLAVIAIAVFVVGFFIQMRRRPR